MKLFHTIEKDDVEMGVYRHPLNSPERAKLVAIQWKFGGIHKCDTGVRVYQADDGTLIWGRELEHTATPRPTTCPVCDSPTVSNVDGKARCSEGHTYQLRSKP